MGSNEGRNIKLSVLMILFLLSANRNKTAFIVGFFVDTFFVHHVGRSFCIVDLTMINGVEVHY